MKVSIVMHCFRAATNIFKLRLVASLAFNMLSSDKFLCIIEFTVDRGFYGNMDTTLLTNN